MDSQERHELKENDLAEFFSNFGQWWQKYGNLVLLVLVLAAGAFAGYQLYTDWTHGAQQEAFGRLATVNSVQDYALIAEEHSQPAVQALASLRGGDLALQMALRPEAQEDEADEAAPDADGAETDDAAADDVPGAEGAGEPTMSPDEALDRAEALYRRAFEATQQPVYQANALLGLAQVAETRGRWDDARNHYREAEQLATEAHLTQLARQATERQALIERLQEPVVFAPESAATPDLPEFTPSQDMLEDAGGAEGAGEAETYEIDVDEMVRELEKPAEFVGSIGDTVDADELLRDADAETEDADDPDEAPAAPVEPAEAE